MADLPIDFESMIRRAAAALRAAGAREVYVFGSFARGDARPGSDLDLAVVGMPAAGYFQALAAASREAGRDVDVVDLDRETPFIRVLKQYGELRRVA